MTWSPLRRLLWPAVAERGETSVTCLLHPLQHLVQGRLVDSDQQWAEVCFVPAPGRSTERYERNAGSPGRLSLETFDYQFTGTVTGVSRISTIVRPALADPVMVSRVRLARIDGVDVIEPTRGSYPPADVEIQSAGEATLVLEATNVPVDTRLFARESHNSREAVQPSCPERTES